MKIKLLLLSIAVLAFPAAHCQKIIISGEEGNRNLVWNDFTGKVDKHSPYDAVTKWKLKSKFSGVGLMGDSVIIKNAELTLELDPEKSWAVKYKESDKLLRHEQGHFNLGILCMYELLEVYSKTKFTLSNIATAFQNIMTTTLQKYSDLSDKYDNETRHGMNVVEQDNWNDFFEKNLKKTLPGIKN